MGLRGINLDSAFLARPLQADDAMLYPLYEEAQRPELPVILMTGPTSADLRYAHPASIGRVAREFAHLKLVVSHGGHPFVAFMYENVYVYPNFYLFIAGSKMYIEAVNGFMRHQFLFGTGYPFRPMKQTVDEFMKLGFSDKVLPDELYNNAAALFKIS